MIYRPFAALTLAFLTGERAFAEEMLLKPGAVEVVTLSENASTGFAWRLDADASQGLNVVVAVSDAGHRDGATMPGAPGTHRWSIRALKAGTATVTLVYQRPWEKTAPAQTRRFNIRVR